MAALMIGMAGLGCVGTVLLLHALHLAVFALHFLAALLAVMLGLALFGMARVRVGSRGGLGHGGNGNRQRDRANKSLHDIVFREIEFVAVGSISRTSRRGCRDLSEIASIETDEPGTLVSDRKDNRLFVHGRKHRRGHTSDNAARLFHVLIGLGRGWHFVAMRGLRHDLMMAGRRRASLAHRHGEGREGEGRCNQHEMEKAYAHARSYGRKAFYWQRHGNFITPGLALSGEYVYHMGDAAASVYQAVCAAWTAPHG